MAIYFLREYTQSKRYRKIVLQTICYVKCYIDDFYVTERIVSNKFYSINGLATAKYNITK